MSLSKETAKDESKSLVTNLKESELWFFVKLAFIAVILVLIFYFANFHSGISEEQSVWGAFGDFFGGVLNPIFGLLSFIAVLATLKIQHDELKENNRALNDQFIALDQQKSAQENQVKILQVQNFETNFHYALSRVRSHYESVEKAKNPEFDLQKLLKGQSFEEFYNNFTAEYNVRNNRSKDEVEIVVEVFESIYKTNLSLFKSYFGSVDYLMFILMKFRINEDIAQYIKAFKSEVSVNEFYVLFYYFIYLDYKEGKTNIYIKFLNGYTFFEEICPQRLANSKKHSPFLSI